MYTLKRDIDSEVKSKLLPIMDSMELLGGRWRIIIMTALYVGGKMRFRELQAFIPKISGRSLSMNLKCLEQHGIVSRRLKYTSPVTVEYELTEYALSLDKVFVALTDWGINHRKKIIGN